MDKQCLLIQGICRAIATETEKWVILSVTGRNWTKDIYIGGHRHRSQCRRYPTFDIDICYSDIGDKYVGLKNVIPILEVFRYQHQSSFRYPILKKQKYFSVLIRTLSLGTVSKLYNINLLWLSVSLGMSDIGYLINFCSDIMSDSALSVRYRKFRYQAQSDSADHGYQTKCPPVDICRLRVIAGTESRKYTSWDQLW